MTVRLQDIGKRRRLARGAQQGFTLIELLVVIAIIGVLIGLKIESAKLTDAAAELVESAPALAATLDDHGVDASRIIENAEWIFRASVKHDFVTDAELIRVETDLDVFLQRNEDLQRRIEEALRESPRGDARAALAKARAALNEYDEGARKILGLIEVLRIGEDIDPDLLDDL